MDQKATELVALWCVLCVLWLTACAACRPVFTIHNLNYGAELIGRAMAAAAVATTVSPTYSKEVSGHPAVAPHLGKMFGVRNGVDVDIWDPSADPFLPVRFDADNFDEGKARPPPPSCFPLVLDPPVCSSGPVSFLASA